MNKFAASLVFCLVGIVLSTNPGLQYRLTEDGLNWGLKTFSALLSDFIIEKPFPSFSYAFTTSKGGYLDLQVSEMKFLKIERGQGHMEVGDGDVRSSVENFGAKITGGYLYAYTAAKSPSATVRDQGQFDFDVKLDFLLDAGVTSTSEGRPVIHVKDCKFSLHKFEHRLSGERGDIVKEIFDDLFENHRETFNEDFCNTFKVIIEKSINPFLEQTPLQVTIPKVGIFDFHLTQDPTAKNKYVEMYHKAQFFGLDDLSDPPFNAEPFSKVDQMRMVTVWLSDFVFNSFFYSFKDQMKIELTPELLGKYGELLQVSCDRVCFGTILPEEIASKYPNGHGIIQLWATEQPEISFKSKSAKGTAVGEIHVYIRDEHNIDHFLFSANVNAEGTIFSWIDNNKVKFELKTLSAILEMIDNETGGLINEGDLNLLIRLGVSAFIKPDLNRIGREGFDLPIVDGVPYSKPELHHDEHSIIFMVDGGK